MSQTTEMQAEYSYAFTAATLLKIKEKNKKNF